MVNGGDKLGISPDKFPYLKNFTKEVFKLTSNVMKLMGVNNVESIRDYNSIQVNRGFNIDNGQAFAPKWHYDNELLWSNGIKKGIFTLHLKNYNAFVTNRNAFKYFKINEIKQNPRKAAQTVYRYGFVKTPRSCYYIDDFATTQVTHSIINGRALANFVKEYNDVIYDDLRENYYNYRGIYDLFKINATAKDVQNEFTESWVIRNIQEKKQ